MKDDLIRRQAAIDICTSAIDLWSGQIGEGALAAVRDKIAELPSAEPEIVRCKDCKHYQFADNRAFGMPVKMCEWFGFEDVDDDDFCSRAERRKK